MRRGSIRFKITLLYSGILLAILVLYNAMLFVSVRSILLSDTDEQLRIKAGEISNVLKEYEKIKDVSMYPLSILEKQSGKREDLRERTVIIDDLWRSEFKTLRLKEDYINIVNAKGQTLLHSQNMTDRLRGLVAGHFSFSGEKVYFGTVRSQSLNLRLINLPVIYKDKIHLVIQVAMSLDPGYRFLGKLMLTSSVCIVLIILLTSFLGRFFVKRILGPVVAVTKAANNISHMDLSTRISASETDIEMRHLIDSFNAMIGRLQSSFMHINEFNSYVAHELKTPLSIIKGELELAVEQAQEKGEDRQILLDCLEEVDRMIKITKDLLLLAKLDYKPQILKFEKMDFTAFFEEITEHSRMLVSEKDISLTSECVAGKLFINADTVHLRRLFLNIVTNAIKYTPAGGSIALSVTKDWQNLYVRVSDTGEGISQEDLTKIFDKFFRVDKGERSQEAGCGLGLSMALSIAKAHQGDIAVASQIGQGTTFTVILPLSDRAAF